jgi:hypothetical protein
MSDSVLVVRRGHVRVSKAKGTNQTGNRNKTEIAALRKEIAALREEFRRVRNDVAALKGRITRLALSENFTNQPDRSPND